MQTLNIWGQENTIIRLTYSCLIAIIALTLVLVAKNLLSVWRKIESQRFKKSVRDYLQASDVLWSRRNQFLASMIKHPASSSKSTDDSPKEMPENLRRFVTNNSISNFEDLRNSINNTIIARTIFGNIRKEMTMQRSSNERVSDVKSIGSFRTAPDNEGNIETSTNKAENCFNMSPLKNVDHFEEKDGTNAPLTIKGKPRDTEDENNEKHRENSGTKAEEDPNASVSRALTVKFLASILQECSLFKTNSKECLNERTTTSRTNSMNEVAPFSSGKHATEQEKGANDCVSKKEDDYPGKQSGVLVEKEANCMEEKSVMHSSKNAMQSRVEDREEIGPPPGGSSLKNGQEAESTIFLGRTQSKGYGKEEEGLNAMIRRMIISELKQQHKKQQTMLKRAYSDTESVMPRKKQNFKTSLKGRTFFRDLLELEESLRGKNTESTAGSESTVTRVEKITEYVRSTKQVPNRSRKPANSMNFFGSMSKFDSNILLERKVSVPCLAEAEQSIESGNPSATYQKYQGNKSTQTEHVHVIRAIRSCPLRKKRLPLQFQLHRLASDRDAVFSKTAFASLDCSRFVFRKASDNLIYEQHKASCSPSYIPSPERFWWKYVMPSNASQMKSSANRI